MKAGFEPRWEGEIEGYSRKWVAAQHWRVRHMAEDREDALSECKVVYAVCAKHYADSAVDNPAWFMSLFKTSLARYWMQLARYHQRHDRALAAARLQARWAAVSEEPVAPLLAALSEMGALRAPPELLRLLLAEPWGPPTVPPQCARLTRLAVARELRGLLR